MGCPIGSGGNPKGGPSMRMSKPQGRGSRPAAARIVLAALLLAACDQPGFAPPDWVNWGSIVVTASDDRGHALPNLRVEIVHDASRHLKFAITNGEGVVSFAQIESGLWSIRAATPPGYSAPQDSAIATVEDGQVAAVRIIFPANWQRLTGELNLNFEGGGFRPCGEALWWHYRFRDGRLEDEAYFRWNELIRQGGTPIWATFAGNVIPVEGSVFQIAIVIDSIVDMMPKPAYRCPS
jgi:hypothetical protein